jgi:hypothetical protein
MSKDRLGAFSDGVTAIRERMPGSVARGDREQ